VGVSSSGEGEESGVDVGKVRKEQVRGERGEFFGTVLPGGDRNGHGTAGAGAIHVQRRIADDCDALEGKVMPAEGTCPLPGDARQAPPVGIVRAIRTNPEIWWGSVLPRES
jgi:hypothetical protein